VSGAGDVDADGTPDLIIGALTEGATNSQRGAFYVYSGASGGLLYSYAGTTNHEWLGMTVAGVGDLNSDGHAEFAASAFPVPSYPNGYVRVYSGATGATLYEATGVAPENYGGALAGGSDLDGDGVPDLLIGAYGATSGALHTGAVELRSGATGTLIGRIYGNADYDYFGYSLAFVGDWDRDGIADFAVGARDSNDGGVDSGAVSVYSGRDRQRLFLFAGTAHDLAGWSVASAGNASADGCPALIYGAPGDAPGGLMAGSAIVVSSCPFPTEAYCQTSPNSQTTGATISSTGSTSFGASNFAVGMTGTIPNTACILFYGATATLAPFHGGWLCVGSPQFRLGPMQHADNNGNVMRPIDYLQSPLNSGPGEVFPGTAWYFQYWYRDAAAYTTNLSNALRAVFCP
jgi:hypothetical protein